MNLDNEMKINQWRKERYSKAIQERELNSFFIHLKKKDSKKKDTIKKPNDFDRT